VRLFYLEIKKTPWDALYEKISLEFGDEDAFVRFLKGAVPFLKLVRNTRDCLEHKNPKGVVVKDFEVQADGQVHPPTIAINFRGSHQPIVAVFMSGVIASIANGFELTLAHLCNVNSRPAGASPSDGNGRLLRALARFASDSPLEGDGFEPSVPAKFFRPPVDPRAN
jgi:hypothetical protein